MTPTSQHSIEQYIDRYLSVMDKPGFFLEIGCWDGQLISQTAYLEKEKGWKGVCVDPFPRNFDERSCRLVESAISKDGLPKPFVKVTIDRRYGGDVSYFSGFLDTIGIHWPLIKEHCDYTIVEIPTITLKELYTLYSLPNHIEFLSVDTEGSELEIFESIYFDKWSFGLIVFEHNGDEEVKKRIGKLLTEKKYKLVESLHVDDIYINEEIHF